MVCLKPPFRAEDMEGLYKRIVKGHYPRIPSNFSNELSNLIKSLLLINSEDRPSCSKIFI